MISFSIIFPYIGRLLHGSWYFYFQNIGAQHMFLLNLQRLLSSWLGVEAWLPQFPLGLLGKTMRLLASLVILRRRGFISSRHGRIWTDNGCSLGYDFLNNVDSLRRAVEVFSRRSSLSSKACEFFFRMMLYILFSSSLAPCNLRLARSNWKPGNASSCTTRGWIWCLIEGNWKNPATWGV